MGKGGMGILQAGLYKYGVLRGLSWEWGRRDMQGYLCKGCMQGEVYQRRLRGRKEGGSEWDFEI